MLDNALTTQLKTYLEMVREPIVLVPSPYRGDDATKASKSAQMDELLAEIAALDGVEEVAAGAVGLRSARRVGEAVARGCATCGRARTQRGSDRGHGHGGGGRCRLAGAA